MAHKSATKGEMFMIIELGHFMLVLALALALIQSVVPIWGAQTNDSRLMAVASPIAIMQFLLSVWHLLP